MGSALLTCVGGLCVEGEAMGSTSAAEPAESTGAPAPDCGPTTECVPLAPPGWWGPVIAVATEDEPSACPAIAPTPGLTGHAGLSADPPVCACNCDVTNSGCDATVYFSAGRCSKNAATELETDVCEGIALLPFSGHALLPAVFDGCMPIVGEQIPPVQWSGHVQLCEAPPQSCGGGACSPMVDPSGQASTCIWREGDYECPDLAYPQRSVYHGGVDDERACSPCTCGQQASCVLSIHSDTTCSTAPLSQRKLDTEKCVPIDELISSPMFDVGVMVTSEGGPSGTCEPTGGVPTGAAIGVNTFTVCCGA